MAPVDHTRPPAAALEPGSPTPALRSRAWTCVLLAICIAAPILAYRSFSSYVFEDAYITFRYAQNLADGQGFSFNPGQRVLGTTTPLTSLLLGSLGALGLEVATCGKLLFCVALALLAFLGGFELISRARPAMGLLFAVLILLGMGRVYDYFGMETTLHSLLLLSTWSAYSRGRMTGAGILLGLAGLSRYDAVVFGLTIAGCEVSLHRRFPWKVATLSTLVVLPWIVFASWYFGSPLPNTLGAKVGDVSPTAYLLRTGPGFLGRLFPWPFPSLSFGMVPVLPGLLIAGAGMALLRRWNSARLSLAMFPLALWLSYALLAPPPEHTWYLYPAVPFVLLLSLFGLGASHVPWRYVIGGLAILLALCLPSAIERRSAQLLDSPYYTRRILTYDAVAKWLTRNSPQGMSVLTREPGYLSYRTQMPAIDGAGLITKGIRYHGPKEERTRATDIIDRFKPDYGACFA